MIPSAARNRLRSAGVDPEEPLKLVDALDGDLRPHASAALIDWFEGEDDGNDERGRDALNRLDKTNETASDERQRATRVVAYACRCRAVNPDELWSVIDPCLSAEDQVTRRAAARAVFHATVGHTADPEPVFDQLVTLTNDEDPEIRGDATASLQPVVLRYPSDSDTEPTGRQVRAIQAVVARFSDPEVTVRAAALDCFGRTVSWTETLDEEAARDALVALIETAAGDGEYPDPVRERAANQFWDFTVGAPVVTAELAGDLATLSRDTFVGGKVRRALTTLAREQPEAVSGHLKTLLPADVASTPFELLKHVGETDPDTVLGVRERLLAGLTTSSIFDRRHAANALVVVARQRPDEFPDWVTALVGANVDYYNDSEWPIATVATEYPDAATDLAKGVARSVLESGQSRDASSLALGLEDEPDILVRSMAPFVAGLEVERTATTAAEALAGVIRRVETAADPVARSIERRGGLEALEHVEDDALGTLAEHLDRELQGSDDSTD